MKFTEEKLEKAFTELLGQEGFPHHLGITITRKLYEVLIEEDLQNFLLTQYASQGITITETKSIILQLKCSFWRQFSTDVSYLTRADLNQVTKKNGWLFNWKNELDTDNREVYKLTIQGNPSVIQGLVSISIEDDHVYMHLIESAPFNKGKKKIYLGVPGNLVAYA
jgi:hypothetical protein